MSSRRIEKVAQAIREAVSSAILFELRDPRVKNVTVLSVEVSGDVRSAKVYVSIMGDEREQALTLQGLNSSRGFLQSKIADRIKTRYTPILKFVNDQSVKRSIETSKALMDIADHGSSDQRQETHDAINEHRESLEQLLDDGEVEHNSSGIEDASSISSHKSTMDN